MKPVYSSGKLGKLSMYFHKNAGSLLLCIMGNQFLYNNMLDLKNDIF